MKLNVYKITKTGIKFYLRPVEMSDKLLVKKFLDQLSFKSLYYRFLILHMNKLDEFLNRIFTINPGMEMKILAVINQNGNEEVVGVGEFYICSDSLAEVALIVSDNYQNKGIGRELLTHMIQLAKDKKLKSFEGIVERMNYPMLKICETIGFSAFEKTLKPPGVYKLKMYI